MNELDGAGQCWAEYIATGRDLIESAAHCHSLVYGTQLVIDFSGYKSQGHTPDSANSGRLNSDYGEHTHGQGFLPLRDFWEDSALLVGSLMEPSSCGLELVSIEKCGPSTRTELWPYNGSEGIS